MVRSKGVPKKPKDPLLTPPSKPRGFRDDGHGGSMPRNRGGAGAATATAMSPAPASVPNYMRATSSSDAKVGLRARLPPSSASPLRRRPVRVVTRGKVLFPTVTTTGLSRATCSSTLKEAKFPGPLDLAPGATDAEGPAAMRVCPYTYCSLNGHVHAPAVPLRSFLASRRRLIKTQQSMKLKGVSAFRKNTGHQRSDDKDGASAAAAAKVAPLIDEEALGDFFVEVYAGPRVSSDMSCSDMSLDEMDATVRRMEFVVFDRCGADEDNDKVSNDLGACGDGEGESRREQRPAAVCRDSSSEGSDAAISGDFVEELPWMRYQGYEYDSLDDEASEEQVIREDEIIGAEVSEVQEGKEEEGTSGRLGDECKDEDAEGQESKHEENISVLPHQIEMAAEEGGSDCRVGSCKEQDERDEGDNILEMVCERERSTEKEAQEEKISFGVCKLENSEQDEEVAETVLNILEEGYKGETSAQQEEESDATGMESAGKLEVTEESYAKDEHSMPDDGSEMKISETVSGDGCKEDFFEEVTSKAAVKGEISEFCEIGSPDVEIQKQLTDCHVFEQVGSTLDSSFDHDNSTADNIFQQDDNSLCSHDDAQKDVGIITSEFEVDEDDTVDGVEDAHKELEMANASEDSAVAQESSQDGNSGCFHEWAQMEPDSTTCKLEDASEESGITQESSQNGNSSSVEEGVQIEQEITASKVEDVFAESDACQETIRDDNSACILDCAQMELGINRSELEDMPEENGIAQETGQDGNSSYASDDAQSDVGITACKFEVASEEFVIAQEGAKDGNSDDVNDNAQKEPEPITCESQKELEIVTCESEDAHEESDITEGDKDDYTAGAQNEQKIMACESGGASDIPQEAYGHINTTDLSDSDPKDFANACKELCITEETKNSSDVQIPEHTYDVSNVEVHEEPHSPPAENSEAKESSIEDICDAFSGMNLKGDVYLDPTEDATCPRNRLIIARRRRTPEEEEYIRGFNPRAPNFLPLELDPESEKVDLKHQMMDERKNAEEWMIDFALRRAVDNLAPARKKKVELLVQAFETVLPHDEDDKKSITPTRHVQACN